MKQTQNFNILNPAKRAFSTNPDITTALQEIKNQLGDNNTFILFFASPSYNPDQISKEFHKTFPNCETFGCTTAGEIFGGKLLHDSIVSMAFDETIVKNLNTQIINNIDNLTQVNKAFQMFSKNIGVKISEIEPEKYVGILLTDGIQGSPENIISRINEITEIPFIGGSAGDNWKMEHTYIYANGKYYENAALIILFEPRNGFKILKTQSFEPLGEVFTITDADETKRCVKTINNKPAAIFYAEQIGIPIEELQEQLVNYSIGHIVYDEAYLHDTINFDKKYNLLLYSAIPKGAEIQILKITDIIQDLHNLIEKEIRPLKNISAIINFNCGSRNLKIEKEKKEKEFEKIFGNLPAIGFSTYGEFFISFINQTATILILF